MKHALGGLPERVTAVVLSAWGDSSTRLGAPALPSR